MTEQAQQERHEGTEELAVIAGRLDEVSQLLQGWHSSKDSDSVALQGQRSRDYSTACETLEELLCAAQSQGRYIQITIASDPVETHSFNRNAYDLTEVHSGSTLAPGASLLLKHTTRLVHTDRGYNGQYTTVYLGNFVDALEVAEIAEILSNDGSLDLVEAE